VAGLTSALTSVLSGGIACIVGVGAIVWAFPELAAYDEHRLRGPAVERDLAVEMAAVSELELP
jgi:hypothetical protein